MSQPHLYAQIAASIRRAILEGSLRAGDPLPPVRALTSEWNCTPGTVHRAYRELARHGLVESRPGQGTHVARALTEREERPIRRATLVHQAEAFLLEALTAGYGVAEVEAALQLALDRWRLLDHEPEPPAPGTLRFVGSHDPAVVAIANRFDHISPGTELDLRFAGSLGGLVALQRGEADLAGCHLWDEKEDLYNLPYVLRLLPGEPVVLFTLAHRRLGLIVPPGNPLGIHGLVDLARSDLRVATRQRGAGTRVWMDVAIRRAGVVPGDSTPASEQGTETGVARAIAEGEADTGPGIEAAARAYGLDFVFLAEERYDLVMHQRVWEWPAVRALAAWLRGAEARALIEGLGGYSTRETGTVRWNTSQVE